MLFIAETVVYSMCLMYATTMNYLIIRTKFTDFKSSYENGRGGGVIALSIKTHGVVPFNAGREHHNQKHKSYKNNKFNLSLLFL